jgi:hypothetical protein
MITQADPTNSTADVNSLPPDTIAFAQRMFDAARAGDTNLILSAVDAGLPPNLTNDKGQNQNQVV